MPLTNVENVEINPPKKVSYVEKAIQEAARDRGWRAKTIKPGVIKAKLFARSHEVTVKIPFSKSSYSILYVDSKNMAYDGENIHKKYGKWVSILQRDIDRLLFDE